MCAPDWNFSELKFTPAVRALPGTLLFDSDGKWVDASGREGLNCEKRIGEIKHKGYPKPLLISTAEDSTGNIRLSSLLNINENGQWCVEGVEAHVANSSKTNALLLERALAKYGVAILTPGDYALCDHVRVRPTQTILVLPGVTGVTIDSSQDDARVIWAE
jgi:hypothetical protein